MIRFLILDTSAINRYLFSEYAWIYSLLHGTIRFRSRMDHHVGPVGVAIGPWFDFMQIQIYRCIDITHICFDMQIFLFKIKYFQNLLNENIEGFPAMIYITCNPTIRKIVVKKLGLVKKIAPIPALTPFINSNFNPNIVVINQNF